MFSSVTIKSATALYIHQSTPPLINGLNQIRKWLRIAEIVANESAGTILKGSVLARKRITSFRGVNDPAEIQ
jgi:hypothetical protein